MRFRAKLVDVGCINHFIRLLTCISKLTKACTMRITPDHLHFTLSDRASQGAMGLWCELQQANFFDKYQMDGVSAEHNEIYLDVAPESVSRALRTAQAAKSVKIKLTRKHCPCLTLAVELLTVTGCSRVVTHDIPVYVVPRQIWCDYREPSMPDFDVGIYLPPLKTLKGFLERMKSFSNFVVVEANQKGEMNLKIETELLTVTTHFHDLGKAPWVSDGTQQRSGEERDPEEMASARTDIRKLLQFVSSQLMTPKKAVCNIVDNSLLHFTMFHEDHILQYFIPAMTL
ncbi:checkpoint protein HUS1 isoform X3 [Petromyzon marinus]|uniref:Checkpoint protein n=2 Tax=Petromyzon marinus TaxID=7757 RepID=A0AAJ7T7X2_PETMA|nr:checkpoint protein HUS1 isoform X1 [Petromyzon marinus]